MSFRFFFCATKIRRIQNNVVFFPGCIFIIGRIIIVVVVGVRRRRAAAAPIPAVVVLGRAFDERRHFWYRHISFFLSSSSLSLSVTLKKKDLSLSLLSPDESLMESHTDEIDIDAERYTTKSLALSLSPKTRKGKKATPFLFVFVGRRRHSQRHHKALFCGGKTNTRKARRARRDSKKK